MIFNLECDGNTSVDASGESNVNSTLKVSLITAVSGTVNPIAAITVSSPSSPLISRTVGETGDVPPAQALNLKGSLNKLVSAVPASQQPQPGSLKLSTSPHSSTMMVANGTPANFPVCSIPPLARSRPSVNVRIRSSTSVIFER